jgi:hypothetical protein
MKIFEIANTLLDVINCVPSLTTNGSALMTQGPRDIFHGLSCLLASLSGGNSQSLTLLQGKMAESTVPFRPIPRFVEVHDDNIASPNSNELNSAISPRSADLEYSSDEWHQAPVMGSHHSRNDSNETQQGSWIQPLSSNQPEPFFVSSLPVMNHDGYAAQIPIWTPLM